MKTTQLLTKCFIIFSLPALLFGSNLTEIKSVKTTKEKVISKTFNVNKNATIKVDNSYGNIDITTWTEDRAEFEIIIKVTGNDEDDVNDRLDDIDVKFSASKDWVAAETLIKDKNSNSWWRWGNNKKLKMEINYIIKLPITNNVNLNNDYGNINVDTLEGKAVINCDYGKITTKELMAENNMLNFDYTNDCYFEFINSGKIHADYSSYTVGKAKNLEISADYTKSIIEVAENVNYNCDYGSMKVDNINNLDGKGDYLTVRLGNVYNNVTINADYGSIKIDRMASNAGNVLINTEYVGITLGYDSAYNFDFEFDMEYGGLSGTENFNFNTKRIQSSEKYYTGYHGAENSGNKIKINSEYGSITFKQN
ncbi:MAG: hypothetical protein KJO22_04920 [Bacteroidia bacterium]|nr:hypothetical protein [Bacteroidia bacterium]